MSAPARALVETAGLTVRYANAAEPALVGVDLVINEGQRLAVVGESGSGKSTLALTLAGLLPPATVVTGDVRWTGAPPSAGRDIGYVFQDPGSSLNPVLRVGEQVAEVARRHLGMSWSDAYAHAQNLLGRVKLPDPARLLRAYPHQLSGGQRQRVAIASAIAAGPRILVADEATSALDTIVQAEIVELLGELVRERGTTLIFITHDIALAGRFADRIAVLERGRLMESGPAAKVIGAPSSAYTASLIRSHIDLRTPPLVEPRT